jgi:cytochrome c6
MRVRIYLTPLSLALVATTRTAEAGRSPVIGAFATPNAERATEGVKSSVWGMVVATASVAIALSSAAPPAYAADLVNGAALFQANCASCHAGGKNFVAEKKTLEKAALEKFQSLDQAKLQKFVQTGMPHKFLPLKFSEQDYVDSTSYVLDQAVNDKW